MKPVSDWRECRGGPLDGDRIDADYPMELEVIVTSPGDRHVRGLQHPDSPVPTVCCCTTKARQPFNSKVQRPVHVYLLCPDGHYHHVRVK